MGLATTLKCYMKGRRVIHSGRSRPQQDGRKAHPIHDTLSPELEVISNYFRPLLLILGLHLPWGYHHRSSFWVLFVLETLPFWWSVVWCEDQWISFFFYLFIVVSNISYELHSPCSLLRIENNNPSSQREMWRRYGLSIYEHCHTPDVLAKEKFSF